MPYRRGDHRPIGDQVALDVPTYGVTVDLGYVVDTIVARLRSDYALPERIPAMVDRLAAGLANGDYEQSLELAFRVAERLVSDRRHRELLSGDE